MSRYVMAIDANKCINCKACLLACQQRNGVPYSLARNWVKEFKDPTALLGVSFQPGACMHCDNPPCVHACPTHATYKASNGSVVVDPSRCIGCGGCIEACPYEARYMDPVRHIAEKCDYCQGATPGQVPACVQVCPVHCRIFGDADNSADPVAIALKNAAHVYIKPQGEDPKPTLTYLHKTVSTDWPQHKEMPTSLSAIASLSSVVKVLGGLSLFGVIGVFIKQLLLPEEEESHNEEQKS